MAAETRRNKDQARGFLLGILYSAWFLHAGHGYDTFAEDLILEAFPSVASARGMARREEYHFRRGFWAECARKESKHRKKVA